MSKETAPPLRPLPRSGRRSRVLLGLVLIAVSATVVAWLFVTAGQRVEVLMVVRDVPVGAKIGRADLAVTRAAVDPAVQAIPAAQADSVVGRIAATDLRTGSLLTHRQVTTALAPGQGQQIVAVGVRSAQLPAGGLRPGDQVLVVATPGSGGQDTAASAAAPLTRDVAATVDRVAAPDADGMVVVNLLVGAEAGPAIARQASLGRIALVVTARRG
ncbi:SAF domain-containing protein [Actinomadura sp. SCN-SB]|uniref:SAF domain-containing protein n=1 Tax=Actinomadura sp. SCN-SB TaxID=3373092 RepID=UPI003753BD2C